MNIDDIRNELIGYNKEIPVRISNGNYIKDEFGSDKGKYHDMYLGFVLNKAESTINTVQDLLELLNKAVKVGVIKNHKGESFSVAGYTCVTIGEEGIPGRHIHDIVYLNDTVYLVVGEYKFTELWHVNEK